MFTMQLLTDDILLQRLKDEDNASFRLLYEFYYSSIAYYIMQNHGSSEDAEDIFQEAILVLLQKVRQPHFELTSSLKTYLYAVARNLWLKRLRDNKINIVESEVSCINSSETFEIEQEKSREEKVQSWLQKITRNCQNILKALFFYEVSMDSLIVKMGWKNKHTAANQQYKCIEQIRRERKKEESLG